MIYSLRNQIWFALSLLIAIVVTQTIITINLADKNAQDEVKIVESTKLVERVHEIEKQVLNLQRNVHIYKSTGSQSVADRFNQGAIALRDNLDALKVITDKHSNQAKYDDYLIRLGTHLDDYTEHFARVRAGKKEQKKMVDEILASSFSQLDGDLNNNERADYAARLSLALAQKAAARYMLSPGYAEVAAFKLELTHIRQNIQTQSTLDHLERLELDFIRLTQVTRGYVFLVNVVMAGTANEFLYLAKEVINLARDDRDVINDQIRQSMESATVRNNFIASACIVIALLMAFLINRNIILPIHNVTRVFKKIMDGETIKSLPNVVRDDEVGQLSKAAHLFYEHNLKQEKLNAELEIARQSAEEATNAKSMFLANMSHEIRTPISGIMGVIQLCLRTELTTKQLEYLNKAKYSGEILMGVINDVLDVSKIEAGKLDIEAINFDLSHVIESVVAAVQGSAEIKHLQLRLFIEPQLRSQYVGDPLRISQILMNLLNNSIKFTAHGHVSVYIGVKRHGKQSCIAIEVNDTGIGMTRKEIERVFQPFSQADESTSRNHGGTGLGLTIVAHLVGLMGGSIEVDSKSGFGSKFQIFLPLKPTSDSVDIYQEFIGLHHLSIFSHSNLEGSDGIARYLPHSTEIKRIRELSEIEASPTKQQLIIEVDSFSRIPELEVELASKLHSSIHFGFVVHQSGQSAGEDLTTLAQFPILTQPFSPEAIRKFLTQMTRPVAPQQPEAPPIAVAENSIKGHILVVEDNPINQMVVVEMLEDMGITCEVANNGEQAIDRISGSTVFDLVLMDVQMPVMDGLAATKAIRSSGYTDLPICGLSANAMQSDIDSATAHGMTDYLTKPIIWDELEKTMSKYLAVST